jgi:hypothetical protein
MLKSFQWQWIKEQGYIEILEMWEKIVAWNINLENIVCATNEMKNVQWVEESGKIRKKIWQEWDLVEEANECKR